MLEDMIVAAVNEAMDKADAESAAGHVTAGPAVWAAECRDFSRLGGDDLWIITAVR